MLQFFTSSTGEIDDRQAAVDELLAGIDLENGLLAYSLGIIVCDTEFIENGTVRDVCDALPFDVIGVNTEASAVPGQYENYLLSLFVMSSDEKCFAAGLSEEILPGQDNVGRIKSSYDKAVRELAAEKPALLLTYGTVMPYFDGDRIVDAMDEISGSVPNFGSLGLGFSANMSSMSICNGKAYGNRIAFAVLGGIEEPAFILSTVSAEKVYKGNAVITECEANIIKQINGKPAVEYMHSLGLAKDGTLGGATSIPFVIESDEFEHPVIRNTVDVTPEGYIACFSRVPQGAELAVGDIDPPEVLLTSRMALEEALEEDNAGGLLIFSCMGRNVALELEPDAEMELVQELIGGSAPYLFSYSGGEICPVRTYDGRLVNQFHNDTLIICKF